MATTVLLIDDDTQTMDVARALLEHRGLRVATAVNGLEGLRKIVTLKPDFVLSNIVMSVMRGDELIRYVRSHLELRKTPFFFISGLSAPEEIARGLELGADDYIVKPVMSWDDVIERIQRILARIDTVQASRRGKKPLTIWLDPELRRELNILAATLDLRLGDLIMEAISDLISSHAAGVRLSAPALQISRQEQRPFTAWVNRDTKKQLRTISAELDIPLNRLLVGGLIDLTKKYSRAH